MATNSLLLLICILSNLVAGRVLKWRAIEGTKCLDGTTAGFYYDSGAISSTTWVIFLQGGGLCSTQQECYQRTKTNLGSSKSYSAIMRVGCSSKSLLCDVEKENPDFYDAHRVYVPYCTGDLHVGQVETKSALSWNLTFRGHTNLADFVEDMKTNLGMKTAKNILFSGSSAGGLGVFRNVDWLARQFPKAIVKGAPIAGWFLPGYFDKQPDWMFPPQLLNYSQGHVPDSNSMKLMMELFDAVYKAYHPPECLEAYNDDEQFKCTSVTTIYKHIKSPMFVMNHEYDTNMLGRMFEGAPLTNPPNSDHIDYITKFGEAQRKSASELLYSYNKSATDGLFLSSCFAHGGGLGFPGTTKVQGYTSGPLVADWFWGRNKLPHIVIEKSPTPLPSNPTCSSVPGAPKMTFPPSSSSSTADPLFTTPTKQPPTVTRPPSSISIPPRHDDGRLVRRLVTGSHCLDGTKSGYYYGAPPHGNSTTWIFWMQGGGSCSTEKACKQRAQTWLGSSKTWKPAMPCEVNENTLLCSEESTNPDFYNAHHVFLPYCTGDGWMGTRRTRENEAWNLYFSGHVNMRYFINDLKALVPQLRNAKDVMLTGTSAGGHGVVTNVDWLQEELLTAKVRGVPIAQWGSPGYFENQPVWLPPPSFSTYMQNRTDQGLYIASVNMVMKLYAAYVLPACAKAQKRTQKYRCRSFTESYKYIQAPLFIAVHQFDSGINDLIQPTNPPTSDELQYIQAYGEAQRKSAVELQALASNVGDGLFLASCWQHVEGLAFPGTVKINGYTSGPIIADWFWGRNKLPHRLMESFPLPSNPTCKGVPGAPRDLTYPSSTTTMPMRTSATSAATSKVIVTSPVINTQGESSVEMSTTTALANSTLSSMIPVSTTDIVSPISTNLPATTSASSENLQSSTNPNDTTEPLTTSLHSTKSTVNRHSTSSVETRHPKSTYIETSSADVTNAAVTTTKDMTFSDSNENDSGSSRSDSSEVDGTLVTTIIIAVVVIVIGLIILATILVKRRDNTLPRNAHQNPMYSAAPASTTNPMYDVSHPQNTIIDQDC